MNNRIVNNIVVWSVISTFVGILLLVTASTMATYFREDLNTHDVKKYVYSNELGVTLTSTLLLSIEEDEDDEEKIEKVEAILKDRMFSHLLIFIDLDAEDNDIEVTIKDKRLSEYFNLQNENGESLSKEERTEKFISELVDNEEARKLYESFTNIVDYKEIEVEEDEEMEEHD